MDEQAPVREREAALPRRLAMRITGQEPFRNADEQLPFDVLSFWQWAYSDLLNNATRGVVAEFLVAQALGIGGGVREPWAAFDLLTTDGIKVEVKSAAYMQSWHQLRPSTIVFSTRKTREWNAETNVQAIEARWQADVFVFALLAHQDKATVDPLDVAQWQFFAVSTAALNERKRSQHSITLKSLRGLAAPVSFEELPAAVRTAAGR